VSSANTSRDAVRVNVCPGVLRVHGWTAGLFLLRARTGHVVAGINPTQLPLGLAGSFWRTSSVGCIHERRHGAGMTAAMRAGFFGGRPWRSRRAGR
jgi:hypothetical protein